MLLRLVARHRSATTLRLVRLAPLLGGLLSVLIAGAATAASGGGDFPIWRR